LAFDPKVNHSATIDHPAGESPDTVFILGMMHRTGSNLLINLLALHPDCVVHEISEDFLTSELTHLSKYVKSVTRHWNPKWLADDVDVRMRYALGRGLKDYLADNLANHGIDPNESTNHKILATKTPSVEGLQDFRSFFPDACLIILVRDGRAVVESGVRSFGWNFDDACRRWSAAAIEIGIFSRNDKNPSRTMIIRYEDLMMDRINLINKLFNSLGLDSDSVSTEKLINIPVTGSSELIEAGAKSLHWEPVSAGADFRPTDRFSSWSDFRHARFNAIAGKQMLELGYGLQSVGLAINWTSHIMRFLDVRRLAQLRLIRRFFRTVGS